MTDRESQTLRTDGAQRYLTITDEEVRTALTGVWERRRQLKEVRLKPDATCEASADAHAVGALFTDRRIRRPVRLTC